MVMTAKAFRAHVDGIFKKYDTKIEKLLENIISDAAEALTRDLLALLGEKNPKKRIKNLSKLDMIFARWDVADVQARDSLELIMREISAAASEDVAAQLAVKKAAVDYVKLVQDSQAQRFTQFWQSERAGFRADITRLTTDALARGMPAPQFSRLIQQTTGASRSRSRLIARNELAASYSQATQATAVYMQDTLKLRIVQRWSTATDSRTRASHAKLDGQERPLGEDFLPNLAHPHDSRAPASETIQCRCVVMTLAADPSARS